MTSALIVFVDLGGCNGYLEYPFAKWTTSPPQSAVSLDTELD